MLPIVDVDFYIDIIVYVELLLVALGANYTVFLTIARILVVTTFGAANHLIWYRLWSRILLWRNLFNTQT